jgi:hypothetical protein
VSKDCTSNTGHLAQVFPAGYIHLDRAAAFSKVILTALLREVKVKGVK